MPRSKLRELSMVFSVQIINLVNLLREKHEFIISSQIGRSATSIGANIYEANYAQGVNDFISKLEIALKEASETGYWLELLYRTENINEQTYQALSRQCTTIRVMLISSCKKAKEQNKKHQYMFTEKYFVYCIKNSFLFYGVSLISGMIVSLAFSYYITVYASS